MCIYIIKHKPSNEILPLVFSEKLEASTELEMLCRLFNSKLSDDELLKEHMIFYSKKIFAESMFYKLNIHNPIEKDFEIVEYKEEQLTKNLKLLLHKKLENLFT